MTSAEKQKIAGFLDLTADYLGSGYKSAEKEYNFDKSHNIESINKNITIRENDTIEKISEEIKACRNCNLGSTRKNAAAGEGSLNPLVMVIGEGPGEDEDRQGRPFVGKAGQLLDKMLSSIELSRDTNTFIANIIKCRPPGNRDPYPEEITACAHFLERQIKFLKPKFLLITGKIAAQTLLKTNDSIGKLRGKVMEIKISGAVYPLIATYHPAALLRFEDYKRPAWEDLKLLRSRLNLLTDLNENNFPAVS